jgi:hypothetical protein
MIPTETTGNSGTVEVSEKSLEKRARKSAWNRESLPVAWNLGCPR